MQPSVAQEPQEVVAEHDKPLPGPVEIDPALLQHVSGGATSTGTDETAPRGTWSATSFGSKAPRGTW